MAKTEDQTSDKKNQKKATLDALTLLQEHGWRFAFHVGVLSYAIQELQQRDLQASSSLVGFYFGVVLLLLSLYWIYREIALIHRRLQLPPGPMGWPLLGTFLKVVFSPVETALALKKQFGSLYTTRFFGTLIVTLGADDDLDWIWNKERRMDNLVVQNWPPSIQMLLGDGAVSNQNGRRHRVLRRFVDSAFAPAAVRGYMGIIDKVVQEQLREWAANKDSFHSSEVFKTFALRLFLFSAYGHVKVDVLEQLHNDFKLWIQGFGAIVARRIPGTVFAKAMDARDRILETVEVLVEEFKAENGPDSDRGKGSLMGRICYGKDENDNPMTMADIKDTVLTLIFAGHDTTYASMGTALHYLNEHPEITKAMGEEVKGFQEPLDFDELKNAPILNAFMAECWRVDPPVTSSFRRLTEEQEHKGYTFSKDSSVALNILLATRNERIYKQSEEFQIDRFLPVGHPLVQDSSRHADGVDYKSLKASYPVFGGGIHSCIGHGFAKLEMRVLLTRLLQEYELRVQNAEKVTFPVNGFKNEFRLTAREKSMKIY